MSLSPVTVNSVRKRCIDFNVKLAKELQARLPSNYVTLEKMSLLTLRCAKGKIIIFLCLNWLKNWATKLPDFFFSIDKILQQWHKINFIKWKNTDDVIKFWAEVKKYKDASGTNTFEELSDLACSVLSLPHSNAAVERIFSTMNVVKSKLRNKMTVSTLNSIMFLRNQLEIRKTNCFTYQSPGEIIAQIRKDGKYSFRDLIKQSTELQHPSTSKIIHTEEDSTDDEELRATLFDAELEF